jgi:predicted AlkP superfamily phosphohydrolase/phosphomutase
MLKLFRKQKPKLLVIGLDCAAPELVFEQWRHDLPNLNRLMSRGVYGRLRSSIPCITVPAWSVMMSSKDPGVLGIYGFRNRADYSYDRLVLANGDAVKEPRVWDWLGQAGKQVVTIGVPGTYPPRPVNGAQIGCFLTPQTITTDASGRRFSKVFTYPPDLSDRVNAWAGGEYLVDVKNFRTENKDDLLKQIYATSRQHFRVVREMLQYQPWDFFVCVEMGVDRIHHAFWKYHDPTHHKHEPGNPYQYAIRDYYRYIDSEIGELLALAGAGTPVMVVSDHGAKKMDGGVCINEVLMQAGWLTLADAPPNAPTPLDKVRIDWTKTRAWGEGGYYGRVFLNVAGREPQGIIPAADLEGTRDELAALLRAVRGPGGEPLGTVIHQPEEIYREVNGVAPDLIVYWGNLLWRSVGSIGHQSYWTHDNDTGPDDANHAEDGIFIFADPNRKMKGQEISGLSLLDFAPTVMRHFDLPVPAGLQGKPIPLTG